MLDHQLVTAFVDEYLAERKRLAAAQVAERARLERRLAANEAEHDRVIDRLAKGVGDECKVGARSRKLAAEEKTLRAAIAAPPAPIPNIKTHPATITRYRALVADLAGTLNAGLAAGDGDGAFAVRELIEAIVVRREGPNGLSIEIKGRLNALVGEGAFPNKVRAIGGIDGSGGGI